jgi:hypothetical protein
LFLHPVLGPAELPPPRLDPDPSPALLAELTDRLAGDAGRWRPVLRHDPQRRWYTRLLATDRVEVWLLGWTPGQQVPAHDHGGAAGAFTVVDGALVEDQLDPGSWAPARRASFVAGSRTAFGSDHAHVLGNHGTGPATSVHAYSPPGRPAPGGGGGPGGRDHRAQRARVAPGPSQPAPTGRAAGL